MESGPFTGFFRNAPFDKPDVLRGFRGFSPPFFHDIPHLRWKGGFGDYPGMDWQEPVREEQVLIDGMPGRNFFSAYPVFQ